MIAIIYDKGNEKPWIVEDTRFFSKGAVLEQIAKWMDEMNPPEPIYDSTMTEVTVLVTVQVDGDDYSAPIKDVRDAVQEAIENSVNSSEDEGFCHHLADELSIGVSGVEILCVEGN